MRKLYVVPIIHTSPDMGSVAGFLSNVGSASAGAEAWNRHQQTVELFWNSLTEFFASLQVQGVRVYQDAMVAEGEDGLKIVSEGTRLGSRNFQIVAGLLRKGAILVKTENISLVKNEHTFITKLVSARSRREKETAALRYRLVGPGLLETRDKYIANVISCSLPEGGTGILFIGADHNIISKLPADIEVVQVKDTSRVREYHNLLTRMNAGRTEERILQLAEYLKSPVENTI
jgi:hypothetical protein